MRIKTFWVELGLFFTAFSWGLNFSIVKYSMGEITPLAYNAIRFSIAALSGWLILVAKREKISFPKEQWKDILLLGLIGNLLYQLLFIYGIKYTTAANSAVILGTIPIWMALCSHLLKVERLNKETTIGIVAGFSGVIIIIIGKNQSLSFGSESFVGDLIILLAAMVWGIYSIYSGRVLKSGSSPLQLTVYIISISAMGLLTLGTPELIALDYKSVSWQSWAGLAYSGGVSISLAYLFWNIGLKTVGPLHTATYQNLVPVMGFIFGILLLGEQIIALQVVGAITTVAATFYTSRARKRKALA